MTISRKSVRGIKKPNQIMTQHEIVLLKQLNIIFGWVRKKKPDDFVEWLSRKEINHTVIKTINTTIRVDETKIKKDILEQTIIEGRKKGIHFYIASKHDDSAADHKDYQGLIYLDKNAELTEDDKKYLRSHKCMSIQAVTSKPIWFVTRPYCRHYFKPISTDKLLSGNYYIPHRAVGDYDMQTPAHANLQYYEDRLKLYEQLKKIQPSETLENKILKTKVLIAKWRRLI